MNEVKEWYDGYLFGNTEIYNPWSTLMYVKNKIQDQSFKPVSFWANTSGNDLVVNYIQNGSDELHEEFEQLIQGQSLKNTSNQNLLIEKWIISIISIVFYFLQAI